MHAYTRIHTHHAHTHTRVRAHTHAHLHAHTHAHTHPHACMHTCIDNNFNRELSQLYAICRYLLKPRKILHTADSTSNITVSTSLPEDSSTKDGDVDYKDGCRNNVSVT